MEFESPTRASGSPEITDEQRQGASFRHATLEPLHADLASDDMPDEYIANQHILEPTIANIESDTESTETPVLNHSTPTKNHTAAIVTTSLICAISVGAYLYLTQH